MREIPLVILDLADKLCRSGCNRDLDEMPLESYLFYLTQAEAAYQHITRMTL